MRLPPLTALIVLFNLTLAGQAQAYCRLTTKEPKAECECARDGAPFFWGTPNLRYTLHEDGFDGISDQDLRNVLRESFDAWVAVQCDGMTTGLSFEQDLETTARLVEHDRKGSNVNVVSLLSPSEWRVIEPKRPTAYAVTEIWFETTTGEIFGADIHFNQTLGPFVLCPDTGCEPGTNDIRNVATHEIGHFLGLGHSPAVGSTMWCVAPGGELEKRDLADDDRQGLCSIYADGSAWDPSRVDQSLRSRRRGKGCSAVASAERDRSQPLLWACSAIAIALVTRTRRSRN